MGENPLCTEQTACVNSLPIKQGSLGILRNMLRNPPTFPILIKQVIVLTEKHYRHWVHPLIMELSVLCSNKSVLHSYSKKKACTLIVLLIRYTFHASMLSRHLVVNCSSSVAVQFMSISEKELLHVPCWDNIIWVVNYFQHSTLVLYLHASVCRRRSFKRKKQNKKTFTLQRKAIIFLCISQLVRKLDLKRMVSHDAAQKQINIEVLFKTPKCGSLDFNRYLSVSSLEP